MLLYILLYSMYIYYFFGSFFFFFFLKHKLTCPLDEHMYCVNLSRRGKRRKNKPKCTCWALKLLKMCQNTADTTMCVIFWLVFLQWSSFLQQQILGFDRRKTFADTECKKTFSFVRLTPTNTYSYSAGIPLVHVMSVWRPLLGMKETASALCPSCVSWLSNKQSSS